MVLYYSLLKYKHLNKKKKNVMWRLHKFLLLCITEEENPRGIYFIPFPFCNLGCIGQTRKWLKARLDKHRCKVKNEEIYTSSIASHCWFYNHYFDFTEAYIVSSPISTSHLNLYEAFYILKNSNNLVKNVSSTPSISDAWKLLV